MPAEHVARPDAAIVVDVQHRARARTLRAREHLHSTSGIGGVVHAKGIERRETGNLDDDLAHGTAGRAERPEFIRCSLVIHDIDRRVASDRDAIEYLLQVCFSARQD